MLKFEQLNVSGQFPSGINSFVHNVLILNKTNFTNNNIFKTECMNAVNKKKGYYFLPRFF